MTATTPTNTTVPFSGHQATETANSTDATNADVIVEEVEASPNSSLPVEPAYAPIYPRGTIPHRSQITTADTSDPTALPTWIGQVSAAYASGTTLHVTPYGNYGAPPTGNVYVLSANTATAHNDNATINSQTGGGGSDYTLTLASGLANAHAIGDYVVVVATGGISTNNASSVPSGLVGGPGSNWLEFFLTLGMGVASGNITATVREWNPRSGTLFDVASKTISVPVSSTVRDASLRIETHGGWFCVAFPTMGGTSPTAAADVQVG